MIARTGAFLLLALPGCHGPGHSPSDDPGLEIPGAWDAPESAPTAGRGPLHPLRLREGPLSGPGVPRMRILVAVG